MTNQFPENKHFKLRKDKKRGDKDFAGMHSNSLSQLSLGVDHATSRLGEMLGTGKGKIVTSVVLAPPLEEEKR